LSIFLAPGSGSVSAFLVWIRIQDSQMNADPDPQHYYYYDFFSSGSRRAEEDKYHDRDWGDTEEYRRGEERYEHGSFCYTYLPLVSLAESPTYIFVTGAAMRTFLQVGG
jgi:hypothetical protein